MVVECEEGKVENLYTKRCIQKTRLGIRRALEPHLKKKGGEKPAINKAKTKIGPKSKLGESARVFPTEKKKLDDFIEKLVKPRPAKAVSEKRVKKRKKSVKGPRSKTEKITRVREKLKCTPEKIKDAKKRGKVCNVDTGRAIQENSAKKKKHHSIKLGIAGDDEDVFNATKKSELKRKEDIIVETEVESEEEEEEEEEAKEPTDIEEFVKNLKSGLARLKKKGSKEYAYKVNEDGTGRIISQSTKTFHKKHEVITGKSWLVVEDEDLVQLARTGYNRLKEKVSEKPVKKKRPSKKKLEVEVEEELKSVLVNEPTRKSAWCFEHEDITYYGSRKDLVEIANKLGAPINKIYSCKKASLKKTIGDASVDEIIESLKEAITKIEELEEEPEVEVEEVEEEPEIEEEAELEELVIPPEIVPVEEEEEEKLELEIEEAPEFEEVVEKPGPGEVTPLVGRRVESVIDPTALRQIASQEQVLQALQKSSLACLVK